MKSLMVIAAAFILFSCSKQMPATEQQQTQTQSQSITGILSNQAVTIDSVNFKAGYSGSTMSLVFSLYLSNVAQGSVVDVQLNRVNFGLLHKLTTVTNGVNKLYDNLIGSYPTGAQNVFYYFSIKLTSGETLTSKQFQVY